jgi:hypothetical protein
MALASISEAEQLVFLAVPSGMLPAVEEKILKKLAKYFPQVERSNLSVGKWYYVALLVKKVKIGYLAQLVHLDEKGAWFQHAADAYLVAGTTQEEEEPCSKLEFLDDKLQEKVYAVNSAPEKEAKQSQKPAFPFEAWILEDASMKRVKIDKAERASMLTQAAEKAAKVHGTSPANWPEEEDEIAKLCLGYVEEATAEALEAIQVQAASDGGEKDWDAPNFGNKPSNALIVSRTMMKMFEADTEPSKPAERSNSREIAHLSRQVDKISQQLEMLAARPAQHVRVAEGPANIVVVDEEKEQDEVDLRSMEKFGKCAFQLAGAAIQLVINAGTDLSKIAEEGANQVANAKECLTNNHCDMLNLLKDFGKEIGEIDPEHFANAQWKEIMGKSSDIVLEQTLSTGKWGGIVELALALWHTFVEIVVVHADSINAKASDKEVQVAVHPAMLKGLPEGPTKKKMRVFAILKRGHYYLATIKTGGSERAMFNIGKDADEAQALIVAFLKSKQLGPLGQLAEAERRKLIKATIKDGASWAARVAGTPAAGQKNVALAAAAKPAKSNTPCRNFEKDGNCSYGEKCNFVHDGSRKTRNKRQKNQQQAKSAITVVKANQQPKQSAWQQVPSRERQLKVWCRTSVHPGSWRSSLQSINPAAHELVTWAKRSVAAEEWLTVQCKAGEEEKLAKLLSENFKIKQQSRRSNSTDNHRTHHCADFLNGGYCNHHAPYCK